MIGYRGLRAEVIDDGVTWLACDGVDQAGGVRATGVGRGLGVRSLTIDPPAPGRIRLVDLALVNHAHDVGVYLAARDGDVGVVIMK